MRRTLSAAALATALATVLTEMSARSSTEGDAP